VADRFSDPSVRKSIDVDVTLVDTYDGLINDLELTIVREAKRHDADAFHIQLHRFIARMAAARFSCASASFSRPVLL